MQYSFEYENNTGRLKLKTYLNTEHVIECYKKDDEIFRTGGTAVNEITIIPYQDKFAIEYYDLDMEGQEPKWLVVDQIPDGDLRQIFINIDIIDGGSNILRRFRVNPYFGTYKIMDMI